MNAELAGSFNPTTPTTKKEIAHLLVGHHQYPQLETLASTFYHSIADELTYDQLPAADDYDPRVSRRGFMAAVNADLPLALKLRMSFSRKPAHADQPSSLEVKGELYLFKMSTEALAQATYPAAGNWLRSYNSTEVIRNGETLKRFTSINSDKLIISDDESEDGNLTWEEYEWVINVLENGLVTTRLISPRHNKQKPDATPDPKSTQPNAEVLITFPI